jgi:hypothetical protein
MQGGDWISIPYHEKRYKNWISILFPTKTHIWKQFPVLLPCPPTILVKNIGTLETDSAKYDSHYNNKHI